MQIRPFAIDIPNETLDDLRARLANVRWPADALDEGWGSGVPAPFLRRLVDTWLHHFDWREQERRLNRLPQFMATIDDGEVHFVHQRGVGPDPLPLVVTHGWPGSFIEMERLLPLLSDPGAHGGDPADAFHVVVPSLPGFAFSSARPGINSRGIATSWCRLMAGLGYDRFGAQGGDIGAGVAMWLARDHPEHTIGIHLNYVPGSYRPPLGGDAAPLTVEEEAFLNAVAVFTAAEGAYAALQATKPQTLSYALTDSPAGIAAWIAEKFWAWSDHDGNVETAIPLATILTDIMLYWCSGSIDASLALYRANREQPLVFATGEQFAVPVGVARFPGELPMPPRSWLERTGPVARWTEMPKGGHFAALEQPHLLAEEIRMFFRAFRTR